MKFFGLILAVTTICGFTLAASAQVSVGPNGQFSGTPVLNQPPASAPSPAAITPTSQSDQTANQIAKNEKSNNNMMGGLSMAIGAAMMGYSCPWDVSLCVAGAAGAAAGVVDLMMAGKRNQTIDPTSATGYNPCAPGSSDPFCAGGVGDFGSGFGSGSGSGGGGSFDPSTLPGPLADAFNQAQDLAKQNGMDITNPASIEKFKADHGLSGGDGGGMGSGSGFGSGLPADLQAAVDKAKANFLSKYSVSGVPVEGGGGMRRLAHGDGDSDLSKLFGNKDGAGAGRGPASIDGLQKNVNGELIGVAGDNIFKQITRRYQSKIQANTFLDAPASVTGLRIPTKHKYK